MWSSLLERFRAGHFTCKNTDWEKWREPNRKVEPETTDWALHTRIPVRIEPSHFLTAAECWSIAGSEYTQSGIFYFSLFFSPFFPFVSGRWLDVGVLPRLQTCFQFIFLFIYLFSSPATPPSSSSLSSSLPQASSWKTLRLRRDCLPRSRSIGREAPSFLPGVHALHHHSQLPRKSDRNFRS